VFTVDPEGNPSVAALDKCIACNLCMFHCPDLAITVGGKNK
jgi:NAD-dependent dihydropyrimidine dehydrogenase PreA subunit